MSQHAERIRQMADALRAALLLERPDIDLTYKPMFGGAGFWANGKIFAAWFGETLALKLPQALREELLSQGGTPNPYFGEYVQVPPPFEEEPELLAPYVAHSLDYVLKPKKKKRA